MHPAKNKRQPFLTAKNKRRYRAALERLVWGTRTPDPPLSRGMLYPSELIRYDVGLYYIRSHIFGQVKLPISCVFLEANKLNRTQKHHLHIVLTPKQYQLLSDNAQKCGITKRLFIVRLLEGTEVRARPSQEIKALRTEIHHIGNNINQIARSVNAGIARAEDAKQGLYLLDQVYELMYQVAKK